MKKVMKTVAITGIIAALSFTSAEAFAATAVTAPVNVAATAMETVQTGGGSTLGEFVSENEVLVGHHGGGHGHSRHNSHKNCGRNSGHSYKNCPYY